MYRGSVRSFVAIVGIIVACRDVSAPRPGLRIQTGNTSYVLDRPAGRPIDATVTNISSHPITLAACGTLVIALPERWFAGQWEDQSFAGCGSTALTPRRIDPGETLELDARVQVIGAFRLRVPVFVDSAHQTPSDEASPVFNIR